MIALLLLLKGVFFIFDKGERLQRLKWSNSTLGLMSSSFFIPLICDPYRCTVSSKTVRFTQHATPSQQQQQQQQQHSQFLD